MQLLKDRASRYRIQLLLLAVVYNFLVYYGGRVLTKGRPHLRMDISLDHQMPLIPAMVLVYTGCYAFWAVNYILAVHTSQKEAERFILAHLLGETICLTCFLWLPSTMLRPSLSGNSFCIQLLRLVYQADTADNLFPSIHCFVSWLCWIGVRKQRQIPSWYRRFSLIMALLVCVSTLTVKQHVIADVLAGVLLAEASYYFAGF